MERNVKVWDYDDEMGVPMSVAVDTSCDEVCYLVTMGDESKYLSAEGMNKLIKLCNRAKKEYKDAS